VETHVEEVDVGAFALMLERPLEPESLLDEEAFAHDEFMPYWAESWPSGVALARRLAALELRSVTVLELGCGLGLPSLVSAIRGAAVVATDWAEDALALLARNAERNGTAVERVLLDWREPAPLRGSRFDLVLAADVLYEERNASPLLALLPRVVATGGEVLLADPGRRHASAMLDRAAAEGWSIVTEPDALLPRGGIHRLRRA
jgi:predicted nicotinamide N-methyase